MSRNSLCRSSELSLTCFWSSIDLSFSMTLITTQNSRTGVFRRCQVRWVSSSDNAGRLCLENIWQFVLCLDSEWFLLEHSHIDQTNSCASIANLLPFDFVLLSDILKPITIYRSRKTRICRELPRPFVRTRRYTELRCCAHLPNSVRHAGTHEHFIHFVGMCAQCLNRVIVKWNDILWPLPMVPPQTVYLLLTIWRCARVKQL